MGRSIRKTQRPPVYRYSEMLLQRVCDFVDRSYKRSQSIHIMSTGLIHDIEETLSYGAMALHAVPEQKEFVIQCITSIQVKMWTITTKLERIYFSVANSQHHFLTEEQYGEILDLLNLIESDYAKWKDKLANAA